MAAPFHPAPRAALVLAATLAACAPDRETSRRVPFAGNAVAAGSACVDTLRPAAAFGLAARVRERHRRAPPATAHDAIAVTVTNHGDVARRVRAHRVLVDAGPCSAPAYKTYVPRPVDAVTGAPPPEGLLSPGASFELRILPSEVDSTGSCDRFVLGLLLYVEGELACLDGGTWIVGDWSGRPE
jgi:hypothetical protein